MPNFKGSAEIIIQENSNAVGYRFHFTTCTLATANDGFIPFSLTIASATVIAKTSDGTIDTELIDSTTVATPDIDLALSWPTTNGAGRYSLTFVLTMSEGSVMEADFSRIRAVDLG